jgi:N-methylhydantoinase A
MERAVRVITVARGHDPRRFTLVAFGGAGPLHAAELAASLGMPRVYVPRRPGLLSAWGALAAEVVRDYGRTVRVISPSDALLRQAFRRLERAARTDLRREGVARFVVEPALDVRYAGQGYELLVPYRRGWAAAFHREHVQRFGYADTGRPLEVVTLRLRARGGGARLPADPMPRRRRATAIATRAVVFARGPRRTPVYRRDDLAPGRRLDGPAIVCEYSATTLIPPLWRAIVDRHGGLLLMAR